MKRLAKILLLTTCFGLQADSNQWQGRPFASFALKDQSGEVKTNQDFKAKWVIMYFYPKDRTPGCTVEAQNFADDYQKFVIQNAEIVGISYDDVESHQDFAKTYGLKFSLLADTDHELSKAMDVNSYFPWPHPSRQTFVLDDKGIIVKHYEDVDPATHSKELLALLAKLNKN